MTRERLQTMLLDAGFNPKSNENGFLIDIAPTQAYRRGLTVIRLLFALTEEDGLQRLSIYARANDFEVGLSQHGRALAFCNAWNYDNIYGRAFLVDGQRFIGELTPDSTGIGFMFEIVLPQLPGMSEEYIRKWLPLGVSVAGGFFQDVAATFFT